MTSPEPSPRARITKLGPINFLKDIGSGNNFVSFMSLSWGQYPNFIISILENTEYIENLWGKYLNIKNELLITTDILAQ